MGVVSSIALSGVEMGLPLPVHVPTPLSRTSKKASSLHTLPVLPSHWDPSLHGSHLPCPSLGNQPAAQPTSEQKWDSRNENSHLLRRPMGWEIHTIISLNPHFHEGGAGITILQMKRLRLKEVKPLAQEPPEGSSGPITGHQIAQGPPQPHVSALTPMSVHSSSPFQAPSTPSLHPDELGR